MEDLYSLHSSISCSDDDAVGVENFSTGLHSDLVDNLVQFNWAETRVSDFEMSDLTKAQIANHPLYPNLVSAHIECRKVGAPPEMALLLEEISKENLPVIVSSHNEIGVDPELDEFMESYCEVLHKYKEQLLKQFDEATAFLSNMESQLNALCNETLSSTTTSSLLTLGSHHLADEAAGALEEYPIGGEVEASEIQESSGAGPAKEQEVKQLLLRKYSGYLSSLRKQFLKKRKKGRLPKETKTVLLDWWNTHYRWPYPTEEDKMKLSESTGLDQKQINNWFVNQRKRHWKPSEDMRFAVTESINGSIVEPMYYDAGGGTGSINI